MSASRSHLQPAAHPAPPCPQVAAVRRHRLPRWRAHPYLWIEVGQRACGTTAGGSLAWSDWVRSAQGGGRRVGCVERRRRPDPGERQMDLARRWGSPGWRHGCAAVLLKENEEAWGGEREGKTKKKERNERWHGMASMAARTQAAPSSAPLHGSRTSLWGLELKNSPTSLMCIQSNQFIYASDFATSEINQWRRNRTKELIIKEGKEGRIHAIHSSKEELWIR